MNSVERSLKVCQFLTATWMERGGGERVQEALWKALKAKVYTYVKRISRKEIKQVGDSVTRVLCSVTAKL